MCFLSKNSRSIHLGNQKDNISFLNPAVNVTEGSDIFLAFSLHQLSLPRVYLYLLFSFPAALCLKVPRQVCNLH